MSQYWQVPEEVDTGRGEAAWAAETAERIREAVRLEMVSDVPLGAFLSGGLDSSTVVANMARFSSQPVKTYSIGFDTGPAGRYYNELPYARQVSEAFGTDHKEILVRPDVAALAAEAAVAYGRTDRGQRLRHDLFGRAVRALGMSR